jgi:hypothetical protein
LQSLSKSKIASFLIEGREISEKEGDVILDQFEKNQPQMYQAIFGQFSDGIAEENIDMSNLFLDLCFDIILVYKREFGDAPVESSKKGWFNEKAALLDATGASPNSRL